MVEITNLKNDKKKLQEESQVLSHNLRVEKEESKRAKEVSSQTNALYEQELAALKKDLEHVQNSYLKEREHFLL